MSAGDALAELYRRLDLAHDRGLGARSVGDAMAKLRLPSRGVYFFLDPAEDRGGGRARIVRVGTHALGEGASSTLVQRLSQHRGKQSSGGGNHRGSIFRLLVGQALIAGGQVAACRSWGLKSTPSLAEAALGLARGESKAIEEPVERAVSAYIARLPVIVVPVEDEPGPGSARGIIESGAIALLSEARRLGLVQVGSSWLGRNSDRPAVLASGLWNQRHVGDSWSADFLGEMERRVPS